MSRTPLVATIVLALACADRGPERPLVFAAASLADVLEQIGDDYLATAGEEVDFHFAGSNDLARQVLAGAPADLLITADRRQAERIVDGGRVTASACRTLLSNRLVVVGPAAGRAAIDDPRQLLEVERLILADPESVPAGIYARRWLEARGLWSGLEGRVVPALDVRAALAAVIAGRAETGIVYATDAAVAGDRVRVLYEVEDGPPITYVLCELSSAAPVRRFVRHLLGPEARGRFSDAGFVHPPQPPPAADGR